jgi:hypothetical protein
MPPRKRGVNGGIAAAVMVLARLTDGSTGSALRGVCAVREDDCGAACDDDDEADDRIAWDGDCGSA